MTRTTYTLQDGGRITATSADDFVRQLHSGSRFDSEGTDFEFMNRFADRFYDLHKLEVRVTTSELFLSDLIHHGYAVPE